MTDNQEPAETEILGDVGSSKFMNEKATSDIAHHDDTATNTSLSTKTVSMPSPSSSASLGDNGGEITKEVPNNNLSMASTFVQENGHTSDEEGHFDNSAFFSVGQESENAAIESEYDAETDSKEHDNEVPQSIASSTATTMNEKEDAIQTLSSESSENEKAMDPNSVPSQPSPENSNEPEHLRGMNQPSTLAYEDEYSLGSVDLFDPPKKGLAKSKPLLAAAIRAKEQVDQQERDAQAKHLEGMDQLRNNDDPETDSKEHDNEAEHLRGMNQPSALVEDEHSLGPADLFDPPKTGLAKSKPLLAAAIRAKEQGDQQEREARANNDDAGTDSKEDGNEAPQSIAFTATMNETEDPENFLEPEHLRGMNQPSTLAYEDEYSLGSVDLFDPSKTGLAKSKPLLAAAIRAKEQVDQQERDAKHLEGMNQPTTIVEDDEDSLEFGDLFDPPKSSFAKSKPLLAAAMRAKEQADQAERGARASHLKGMNQPATILEEDEESLGSDDLFDPPKTGLAKSKPLLAAAIKAKEQADQLERSASNHSETQNAGKELTSKSQDKDDIIPNSTDDGGANDRGAKNNSNQSKMSASEVLLDKDDDLLETRIGDIEENRNLYESDLQEKENIQNKVDDDGEKSEGDRENLNTQAMEASLVHTGRKNRSASSASDDSSSWRGVVIGLTVCFFFIIAAQGITIGILTSSDDDDNAATTSDRGTGSAATDVPTVTPKLVTGFRSIANEPGAVRLDLVSECSTACTESFDIPAAFDMRWGMSDFVRLMSVSSNGDIILECDFSGTCGVIETLGSSLGLGVDTSIQGDIFVLPEIGNDGVSAFRQAETTHTPSLTVSWENIQLSGGYPAEEEYQVNVQVTILEGKIQICYGEGNTKGAILVASFLNVTEGTSSYPDRYPFSGEGIADRFPSNQCFTFENSGDDDNGKWTIAPTPSSSWFPGDTPYPATMGPTNPSFSGFVSLELLDGAIPLPLVSSCDDCYESVPLPTTYLWDGKYAVSSLLVSSNGYLELVGSDGTKYVRVNVVSMDLDTSRDNEINVRYFRREPSGVTFVSWENMQVFGASNTDNSLVNGQVLIHPEGRIDICWGEILLDNELLEFESNIYGYVDGSNYYATGPQFDPLGHSNGESLLNTCQTLVGDSQQTVSTLYVDEFTYLSTVEGAKRLETVSAFDDNDQIVELEVPIRWVQDTFTDRLLVSSNGVIRVDGCPVENFECGEIAVASADLDPATSGNVWFFDATKLEVEQALLDPNILYIISWENVSVYSFPSSRINAQALFYGNGTIEICFGEAEFFEITILAGIFDPRFSIDEPAWGEGVFSFGGFTEIGVWPTGLCQSFYVARSGTLPSPSLQPISTTASPTDAPSLAPRCKPTSGACVSTESDLARELNEAREGDIVALCGDMGILRTIRVVKSNMTLCCVRESSGCSLDGALQTQIMSVSGANFTLTDIKFQNGVSNRNGGNLALDAPGHHSINNCLFSGGQTSFMFGGNLYVANGDSISISDCRFDVGTSPLGGSGVAFENTWSVDIRNSKFQNNYGQGAGGGVLVYHAFDSPLVDARMQQLYIENSVFEENSAEIGGGLAIQDVDAINMTVLQSVFTFNVASVVGGALSVTGINSTMATLRSNSGEGNTDGWLTCKDFFFDDSMDYEGGLCFDTGEMIQLSDDDFRPDQTVTPTRAPDEVPVCTRTFPTCAETEDDIRSMLLDAEPNDVVSLCGGMVSVSETLQVSQLNVTLCCEAYPRCTLSATNLTAPVMSVSQGGNFTAIGISFQSGVNGGNGGNLLIDAPGYHSIQFCGFFSGFSEAFGGSLYVGNANSVAIAYSHFSSGTATGGGAAAFVDTKVVSIEASSIVENAAGFEGGGLLFLSHDENSEMSVSIAGTAFEGNSATDGGGGFAVRGMGSVQFRLSDSWFYDNVASSEGASGKIAVSKVLDVNFEGNLGDFNVDSTDRCEWIFVENESPELSDLCFNLNSEASFSSALPLPTSTPSSLASMG